MQATRLFRQLAARQIGSRSYTGGHQVSTLNDLPIPQGSWQTHNDAKQRRYNLQLVMGIGIFFATIIFGKSVGFLEFHNDIPERPADIASYK